MSENYVSFDYTRFLKANSIKFKKPKNSWDHVPYDTVKDGLTSTNPDRLLFTFAYAIMRDSESNSCYDYSCRYRENAGLDRIYRLLYTVGYEMSDEEKRFVNGELALSKGEENE